MRVNIEEEAWKRIYKAALDFDLHPFEVAGAVACLWSTSQDEVKTHGTKDQLLKWASLQKLSEEKKEMWITALKEVRFISCGKDDLWKIHGNKEQLEAAAKRISKASKGGKALRKKIRELGKLKAGSKQASGHPENASRGSSQVNAMQFKSMQFNQSLEHVENFFEDPVFVFLEGLSRDGVAIDSPVVSAVLEKLFERHPRKSNNFPRAAAKKHVEDPAWTLDGLKWLVLASIRYSTFCAKNQVERVYSFATFLEKWTEWLPEGLDV